MSDWFNTMSFCCLCCIRCGGIGHPSPLIPSVQVLGAHNPLIPCPQVLGFSKGPPGGSFAVPFSHSFSGRAVGAELSLAAQRHEYCEGHRRRRAAAAELMAEPAPPLVPAPSEVLVQCGVFLPPLPLDLRHPPRLLLPLGALRILQKQWCTGC